MIIICPAGPSFMPGTQHGTGVYHSEQAERLQGRLLLSLRADAVLCSGAPTSATVFDSAHYGSTDWWPNTRSR